MTTLAVPGRIPLGVSRRTYYLGTIALIVGLNAVNVVLLTLLWWLELATDGWGIQLHFFQVPWILWGPWYQVLVTNFVLLSLTMLVGLWFGLIYRRFALIGTLVFSGALALIAVGTVLVITWRQWWPQVGQFLGNLDMLSASGLIAVVAAIVALGGYWTIRRITV